MIREHILFSQSQVEARRSRFPQLFQKKDRPAKPAQAFYVRTGLRVHQVPSLAWPSGEAPFTMQSHSWTRIFAERSGAGV